MPSSSVIICTRNRIGDLLHSLDSISKQDYMPEELIIIDSSDKRLIEVDGFKDLFSEKNFNGVSLIYKHTSPGLTKQRNEGIFLSSSEVIYFFDDDVELEPNYLSSMNKVFENNKDYGGGMGCVTNVQDRPSGKYMFFRKFFLMQRDYSSGNFTWSGMPTHTYGINKFLPVQVLGGCCFSFRRNILKNNLFDETLGAYAYMEDCDISKRVSDNYELFYNPEAKLKHYHSPASRDKVLHNRAMYIKNYKYLFFKNFYPKNKIKVLGYYWTILGLFLEAILFWRVEEIKGYIKGLRG